MNIPIFTIESCPIIKETALAYGHFNSVHPGHIRYLKNAASQGKSLIVAVLPDTHKGKNREYKFTQKERAEGLASINIIDGILLLKDEESSLVNAINVLNPSFLVLGTEFEDSKDPEIIEAIRVMKQNGLKVQFHAGEVQYASTELLENSESYLQKNNKIKFKIACKKQNINKKELIKFIDSWTKTNLLVIGDSILDQYAGCEALGMLSLIHI